MENFDWKLVIRDGLIGGMIVILQSLLSYVLFETLYANMWMSMVIGIVMLAVMVFLGIWGGISYRRAHGNVISFIQAFVAVFTVFVMMTIGSHLTNTVICKVIDTEYPQRASSFLKDKMSAQFEKMNMTDDQIQDAMKGMTAEEFNPPMSKLLLKMAKFLAAFAVIALITAAFIKRNSDDLTNLHAPPIA
jgi:hypothetical protein